MTAYGLSKQTRTKQNLPKKKKLKQATNQKKLKPEQNKTTKTEQTSQRQTKKNTSKIHKVPIRAHFFASFSIKNAVVIILLFHYLNKKYVAHISNDHNFLAKKAITSQ